MGGGQSRAAIARFSEADAAALPDDERRLDAVARVLRMLADRPPPDVGGGPGAVARAIDQAWRLLRLPIEAKRDAVDLCMRSVREVRDGVVESQAIKAVFGFGEVGTGRAHA